MCALLRLSRFWSPFDRRLVVAGVIIGFRSDGSPCVALDPIARLGALSPAWSDTFSAKPSCMATADEVIASGEEAPRLQGSCPSVCRRLQGCCL